MTPASQITVLVFVLSLNSSDLDKYGILEIQINSWFALKNQFLWYFKLHSSGYEILSKLKYQQKYFLAYGDQTHYS